MRGLRNPFPIIRRAKLGPNPDDLARAAAIIASAEAPRPDDWLALAGDKQFLFSKSGQSFLTYAVQGRAFAICGAPVGKSSEKTDMLEAALALARKKRLRCSVYNLFPQDAALMTPFGLKLYKIGETALIDLADYSLRGKRGDNLRATRNRLIREGAVLNVISPAEIERQITPLRKISDEWLAHHKSREKMFSLGFFDDSYLRRTEMATIEIDGQIVAFANLWPTADYSILSFDLMRFSAAAPRAVIDFLIMELCFWGQAQGYKALDIGLAPLSGLDDQPHAKMLARMGDFVFDTAERFYGFRGLRQFKEKFHPRWEPRYIAARNQWAGARGLIDCAMLTSGGWRPMERLRSRKRR